MSIIAMPASPVPAEVAWNLNQPTQVNRSIVTGKRRVAILAAAPRWSADVRFPPMLGEPAVWALRAFLAACQGRANSFRLVAVERTQITGLTVRVNGANQYGTSLVTNGWGVAGTKLKAGQFVTLNDQLLQLTADVVVGGGGTATLQFEPWLRGVPADNQLLEVSRPFAMMSLAEDDAGWTVSPGQRYSIAFKCEESF
jgi:hypothetical protein